MVKGVIFDLDGTLIDSGKGIVYSIRYAEKEMRLDKTEDKQIIKYIGMPIREMLKRLYSIESESLEKTLHLYRQNYCEYGCKLTSIFDGVPDMLRELKANGYRIALGTSKRRDSAMLLLKQKRLFTYFDVISTAKPDDLVINKAEIITNAVKQMALVPSECAMVGDRVYDIEGAREAGTISICVKYGYGSKEEILKAKPDFTVDLPCDITQVISSL